MDANGVANELIKLLDSSVSDGNTRVIDKNVFDTTFLKLLMYTVEDNPKEEREKARIELVNIWANYCNSKLNMSLRIVDENNMEIAVTPSLVNLKGFHNGNFHSIGNMYELTLANKTPAMAEKGLEKNIELAKMKIGKVKSSRDEWVEFLTKYTGKQIVKDVNVEETYDDIEESYD